MKINIGITNEKREQVITVLNKLLSDEYVLYTKTRNYHWNVVGPNFYEMHKFLEEQYKLLEESIDEIAERVRAIGGISLGSMAEFLQNAKLKETAGASLATPSMIANLLADHETAIKGLRTDIQDVVEKYEDAGTGDFLTGLMEQHEKMAWMLRAFLS